METCAASQLRQRSLTTTRDPIISRCARSARSQETSSAGRGDVDCVVHRQSQGRAMTNRELHLKGVLKITITAILARHIAAAAEEIAAAMADEIDALARDRLADLHLRVEPAESTAESRANEGERTLRQQNDAAYLAAFRELATAAAKKGGSFRREFAPKGEELSEVGVGPPTACPDIRGLDDDAAAEAMVKWFWENFEDPAHETPGAEGAYVYIWGGPYEARDELEDAFGETATERAFKIAVDEIESNGWEW